jgi:hypothetical protein
MSVCIVRDMLGARDNWDVLVCISKEGGPIFDRHDDMPRVNEVEVIERVYPGALDVVDHEFHVRRYPLGLDRGEVYSEDSGRGMLVSHYTR